MRQPLDSLLVHADFVRRLAAAVAGRELADDLSQDTWLQALQHPPRDEARPRAWLATLVRNLFRDRRRRLRRRQAREATAAAAAAPCVPAVDEIAAREEVRQRVVAAVLQLPSTLRDVVLLRYYEDLDSPAIAARLGRPAGTVRWQLHCAVAELRRRLDNGRGGRGGRGDGRARMAALVFWSKARLGSLSAVLQVAWPLRAAAAVALLLTGLWFVLAPASVGPPPPPVGAAPVAATAADGDRTVLPAGADGRMAVELAATAASPASTLGGRVVRAADDSPIAGAEVRLQHRDADEFTCNDLEYGRRVETLASVRTDADGRFAFAVQRARLHRLHVHAAGFAPVTATRCRGGSERTIALAPGAVLQGCVRAEGRPLGDVDVQVDHGHREVELARGRTAPDGTFHFADLPPGRVVVQVQSPAHELHVEVTELAAARTTDRLIELSAGRSVRGRVVDASTGEPIAGASVADAWSFGRAARSAADGGYCLGGVRGDLLYAQAPGHALRVQVLPATAVECDFALLPGGSVRGRLLDAQGRPLADGYVVALATFMSRSGVMDEDWRPGAIGGDGRFVCDQLDPQRQYTLYARAPGKAARQVAVTAAPAADQMLDLGDIVLAAESVLEGRVMRSEAPVAGARLYLALDVGERPQQQGVRDLSRPWDQVADGEGRFLISGLAHGSYRITVQDDATSTTATFGPFALAAGETREGVELAMPAGVTLAGRLIAPGGSAPPPGFELFVEPAGGGRSHWTRSGEDGSFRFAALDPGRYTLGCLQAPSGWSMPPRTGIAADGRDLAIAVFPAATLRGRVVDGAGRPAAAKVHALPLGNEVRFFRDVATDANGAFTLEVPPDFVGTVYASDPANPFRQVKREQVAAGASDLVLRLR